MWRENELWTDYIRSIIYAKLALKQWKQKQKQIHVAPTSETLTRLYTFFKHRESGFYVCIIVCAMRYRYFILYLKSNRGYCINTYFTHIVDFYMNEPMF